MTDPTTATTVDASTTTTAQAPGTTDAATPGGADADRQRLRAAILSAWQANTWTTPPPGWLDATAAALATSPTGGGDHVHTDAEQLASCHRQTVEELRQLTAATRTLRQDAAGLRSRHTQLATRLRQRAIDQLDSNPGLAEPLRQALADWGLPPIPTDFIVSLSAPMRIRVSATDADDARRIAAEVLQRRFGAAGRDGVSADPEQVEYTDITNG